MPRTRGHLPRRRHGASPSSAASPAGTPGWQAPTATMATYIFQHHDFYVSNLAFIFFDVTMG